MSIRLAVVVWTAALALAGAAAGLVLSGGRVDEPLTGIVLPLAAGLAFVAAGLIAWTRRPESRSGPLMTAVGFTWFLGGLTWSDDSLLFTVGVGFGALAFAFFAWLLVSFPSGRLAAGVDRTIVVAAFVAVAILAPLRLLFQDPQTGPNCRFTCPESAFLVMRSETAADWLAAAFGAGALAVTAAVVARLALRYRRAAPPARRVVAPVYVTAGSLLVVGALTAIAPFLIGEWLFFDVVVLVGLIAVPTAFLYGLLRERIARAAVERLVVHLGDRPGPADLREALARALGDPTLALLTYDPELERFRDASGQEVDLGGIGGRRTATVVDRDGSPLGAIVHDVSLLDNRALLDSVTATAGLALETSRRYEELLRAKDRNAALLDAIPDLIFRIGMDGVYRAYKAEDPGELTVAPEAVVGARLHDLLPAGVADRILEAARRARADGGVEAVEYTLAVQHGVRDFEGRVVYAGEDEFLLIVRDFTERNRQEAELRRVSDELRASRARIVEAGDSARRRLERDLHDGAQQRLVSLSVALRLAQSKLRDDPAAADAMLAAAAEELGQALAELRELARGIHPAILTARGLAAAVEALAARSPVPVDLEVPAERLPAPVEAAAYFVVSEALANAAKHAAAGGVSVRIARENGAMVVDVSDDGAGGADPAEGGGLRGLADRVAALDGTLVVDSPPGSGTRVRAVIPTDGAA